MALTQSNVPSIMNIRCTEAISAGRYWNFFRAVQSGWLLIENKNTAHTLRCHFGEGGNENANYKEIKPLHSKPFQINEGDIMWMSSTLLSAQVMVENSTYKPSIDEYMILGDAAVRNVPFYVDGVGVTTTYDCTTLGAGYATQFQVGCEGGFTGTVEYSSDDGVTYSSAVTLDIGQPLKQLMGEEDRIITQIRVTVGAGTFFIGYR